MLTRQLLRNEKKLRKKSKRWEKVSYSLQWMLQQMKQALNCIAYTAQTLEDLLYEQSDKEGCILCIGSL